jgi:hypothetical protein
MRKLLLILFVLPLLAVGQTTGLVNGKLTISKDGTLNIPVSQNYRVNNKIFTPDTNKLVNRYTVGAKGNFTTIQAAITWLATGSNMTAASELLLDGGTHNVSDSITIDLPHNLVIRGISSNAVSVQAATGLLNKPFFSLFSCVTFHGFTIDGSTLPNWGDNKPEDMIRTFGGCNLIELVDMTLYHGRVGLRVLDSTDIWVFNCIFDDMLGEGIGIYNGSTKQQCTYDVEINNFINCIKGIEFADGDSINFAIKNNVFYATNPTDTAFYFTNVTLKRLNAISSIVGNDLSSTTNALVGLDFTLAKNADVYVRSNSNLPDKIPFAKINMLNNTATTTITNVNTFYKANLNNTVSIVFNTAATGGTFTITVGGKTTSAIAYNANSATMATNIKTAIDALAGISTVTVTSVVNQTEFSILYAANEGWETHSANIASLTSVTGYFFRGNTYNEKYTVTSNRITYLPNYSTASNMYISCNILCSNNGRVSDIAVAHYTSGGALRAIYGQMTGIIATTVTPISTNIHVPQINKNDYFEIVLSKTTNAGETLTISDLTWLITK